MQLLRSGESCMSTCRLPLKRNPEYSELDVDESVYCQVIDDYENDLGKNSPAGLLKEPVKHCKTDYSCLNFDYLALFPHDSPRPHPIFPGD